MSGRDGLDDETSLRELESGQFTGELNELADRPSLTGAKAGGLEFESACREFHKTERSVRTASSEQVRQPLFRDGRYRE
jgi:hypothetical protein